MPIQYDGSVAALVDQCPVEEAIQLAEWLHDTPEASVDLSRCGHLHAAVLQTILALAPRIQAGFSDARLERWLGAYVAAPNQDGSAAGNDQVPQWQ